MTAEQERYFKSFLDHMFDHIMDLEERALHHVGADDISVRNCTCWMQWGSGWRTAATP